MDIRKIKKLIELLDETGIAEIEIKEGEESLRLTRYRNTSFDSPQTQYISSATVQSSQSPHVTNASPDLKTITPPVPSKGHPIHSPMVGTMYTSPSPDSPPFVTIGQSVKAGETLCIVEAMKMFNEIESDRAGKIIDILVNNGDPVEYDQILFVIE